MNITITIDDELGMRARELPEVRRTSLSGFVAALLRDAVERSPEQDTERLLESMDRAAQTAQATWKWNREEIYERK